jgi:hypothetical protein
MFTQGFFVGKTKKLLVFENKFHRAFSCENCAGCAIYKSHLAVLVAIRKLQLAAHKKSFEKVTHKNVDKIDPRGLHYKTYYG